MSRLDVLLVSGSLRVPSYTSSLVEAIREECEISGAKSTHWDLRVKPIGFALPEYHDSPHFNADPISREFVEAVEESDVIVLGTPLYHNGYSGVLKNALDTLSLEQVEFKPVGLVSHGGPFGSQAVDQLRIVVRGMRAYAVTTQVCTVKEDFGPVGTNGVFPIVSEEIRSRIGRLVTELTLFGVMCGALRRGSLRGEKSEV